MADEWTEQRRVEITPSEYACWLNPIAALERLAPLLSASEAKTEIYRRLTNSELLSAVRTSNWFTRQDIEEKKYAILGAHLWAYNGHPREADPVWKAASHKFRWQPDPRSSAQFDVECFGVRFEPSGIDAILTDAGYTPGHATAAEAGTEDGSAEKRKTRHGLPAVKEDLLKSWYELFLRAYPDGSKRLAELSARGMFQNHSVDRQKVRDLYGPGTLGRPLINKDK